MMLADMGADVLRIERIRTEDTDDWWLSHDILSRGRRSIQLDLKDAAGIALAADLAARADGFVEGFRPGVAERLGLGPEVLCGASERLVYGRMTGWGQDGPLAARAGHDIDYIAITGALDAIGSHDGPPVPPLNLIGDFGGGGMLLAFGMVCGLLEARVSGMGQVVDAAMVDGAALLMAWIHTLRNAGAWSERRGSNLLDGGAPNYTTYRTADGKYLAVGAMEPRFRDRLLARLGLPVALGAAMTTPGQWPSVRARMAEAFATRTRDEWLAHFGDDDVCVAPVRSISEAVDDPHLQARAVLRATPDGHQPAPAPRFSRTPADDPGPPTLPGSGGAAALAGWGIPDGLVTGLRERGVLRTGAAA